jgi:hypothetical protein
MDFLYLALALLAIVITMFFIVRFAIKHADKQAYERGKIEALKANAEENFRIERKRNEIAAEPVLDRAAVLDGLSEPKRLF